MKPISRPTLNRAYREINARAFNGTLPRCRFLYDRDILWNKSNSRKKRNSYGMSGGDGTMAFIWINWKHHTMRQWYLTLIHEMVHLSEGCWKNKTPQDCSRKSFQEKVFKAMVRMGWGLL